MTTHRPCSIMKYKLPPDRKVLAIAFALLVGCDAASRYRGDGTLHDAGFATAHERYVIDLGAVDLSSPKRQTFNMAGLPGVEFTAGLRPVDVSGGCDARALSEVDIRLSIRTEDGATVVDEAGSIRTWTPSTSLLYRRGIEREEPKPGGVVELIRTGSRASGGWGTYFTPQSATKYVATFEVIQARGAEKMREPPCASWWRLEVALCSAPVNSCSDLSLCGNVPCGGG